jgi:hypothetical protein
VCVWGHWSRLGLAALGRLHGVVVKLVIVQVVQQVGPFGLRRPRYLAVLHGLVPTAALGACARAQHLSVSAAHAAARMHARTSRAPSTAAQKS